MIDPIFTPMRYPIQTCHDLTFLVPLSVRKQLKLYLLDMEICWGLMLCQPSLVLVLNENEKPLPMIMTTVCQLV